MTVREGKRERDSPDEGESGVGLSIGLEGLHNVSYCLTFSQLDTEDSGEHRHSTEEAGGWSKVTAGVGHSSSPDNVVEERSECSKLHSSLGSLHECGVSKKEAHSSTCSVSE